MPHSIIVSPNPRVLTTHDMGVRLGRKVEYSRIFGTLVVRSVNATLSAIVNAMHDGLDGVRAELATISDTDLNALQFAAETAPQLSPELLAFLAHACDWEIHRRAGRHFALS